MMRERDFSRRGIDVASEQPGVAGGVMWRTKGALCDEGLSGCKQPHDTVDFGRLESLIQRQWRKNRCQPFSEHRLSSSRGTDEQDIVAASRGNFESALDVF